ncbi:hypothetical protein ACFW1M_42190 [Streptomyces inhibens]|uniref:hypothetical protein n=1 Tax=Streptomyces inhibens TaxID=2293571 RepID=UPI00369DEC6C
MSEIPAHTLQHRFDGPEDAPVLITGKAPHPYEELAGLNRPALVRTRTVRRPRR